MSVLGCSAIQTFSTVNIKVLDDGEREFFSAQLFYTDSRVRKTLYVICIWVVFFGVKVAGV